MIIAFQSEIEIAHLILNFEYEEWNMRNVNISEAHFIAETEKIS